MIGNKFCTEAADSTFMSSGKGAFLSALKRNGQRFVERQEVIMPA